MKKILVSTETEKEKRKLEFSKAITIIITCLFITTWVAGWASWFLINNVPNEMLEFITVPFGVVITGYFTKAGVENYGKIKKIGDEE